MILYSRNGVVYNYKNFILNLKYGGIYYEEKFISEKY